MSTNTIEYQFAAAFKAAVNNHESLNIESAKQSPCLDSLFEFADKLRDALMLMRVLDDIWKRQATADALATPLGEGL